MNKKVLLIEDDLQMQEFIKQYLKEYEFECTCFSDPKEFLNEYKKIKIILLLY